MKVLRFIKVFVIQLIIAFALICLIVWGTLHFLDRYTQKGQSIILPDLIGLTLEQTNDLLEAKQLRYSILDSIYVEGKPALVVVNQDPRPHSKVKENRTIYLTINASSPPNVRMPDFIGLSLRSAMDKLELTGFKANLIYRPHEAKNYVFEQMYKGVKVEPDSFIVKGSTIDLVLGNGLGSTKVSVPDVIGLSLEEAEFILLSASLNIGAAIYDDTVSDKGSAVIYKQTPEYESKNLLLMGQSVDVYLK